MGNLNSIFSTIVGNQLTCELMRYADAINHRACVHAHLLPKPILSLSGKSAGMFWNISARKHREGVVIISVSLVNSNQAAHSMPPPPIVLLFVRFGLSGSLFFV